MADTEDSDKRRFKAYIAASRKVTVHDWQHVYDAAFGTIVAKSLCGRIIDRRVLIEVTFCHPLCKRCKELGSEVSKPTKKTTRRKRLPK